LSLNNLDLKEKSHSLSSTKSQPKEKIVKPLKKVILPEDNNEFKVMNKITIFCYFYIIV